jgi:hypothetical protein
LILETNSRNDFVFGIENKMKSQKFFFKKIIIGALIAVVAVLFADSSVSASSSQRPATPGGLAAGSYGGAVYLNWTANTETDLAGYQVYRGSQANFTCNDSSRISTTTIAVNGYVDKTITHAGTYYFYKVSAINSYELVSGCSLARQAKNTVIQPTIPTATQTAPIIYCADVKYGDWSACADGWQYRSIASSTPSGCLLTLDQENAKKMACNAPGMPKEATTTSTVLPDEFRQKIQIINAEAAEIAMANVNYLLSLLMKTRSLDLEKTSADKYLTSLTKIESGLSVEKKTALLNFIVYGTASTLGLGQGERAGTVNSYESAFNRVPGTAAEWSDVIKIANGRWPAATSTSAEARALLVFKKIYLRVPKTDNQYDQTALKIIAYGLRPSNRNLNSEKVAINSFRYIYKKSPISASDWDIVRAIAYSGAKR